LEFRLWLEADEDYAWFVHGHGQKKIKQMVGTHIDREHWALAYQHVQQQLTQADPMVVRMLKPDHLNMLLNYLAFLTYTRASYHVDDIEAAIKNDNIARVYGQFQNLVHANASNPKFFQALQFIGSRNEEPAVTVTMLRADTQMLARQASTATGPAPRTGPPGRTLLSFPDGHQWVALDKAFCEREGKAGRHCGNAYGQHEKSDQILSLRNPAGEVEATFVLNHGHLAEAKGPGNQKLDPKFHPYVAALFLANGPKPLPVVSNYFFYGNDGVSIDTQDHDGNEVTINPRPLYMPHKDTTVMDLLYSNTVDAATKGKLVAKFRHELGDNVLMSNYLDHEMDDGHRRKVLQHMGVGNMDQEFARSKQRAADNALVKWSFAAPTEQQIANFHLDHEEVIQLADYSTNELKRLLNHRWLVLVEKVGPGRLATDLEELLDTLKAYEPKKFMYEFDPEIARQLRERPYLADDWDQFNGDNNEKYRYHPKDLSDRPERRAMKKALTKLFRAASQLAREITDEKQGLENSSSQFFATQDADQHLASRNVYKVAREAEKIGAFVDYYLERVK
jgi:hypothetical protein